MKWKESKSFNVEKDSARFGEKLPKRERKTTSLVERGRDKPQQPGSMAQQEKRLGEDYRKDSDNFASFAASNLTWVANKVKGVKSDEEVIQILKELQSDLDQWVSTATEERTGYGG